MDYLVTELHQEINTENSSQTKSHNSKLPFSIDEDVNIETSNQQEISHGENTTVELTNKSTKGSTSELNESQVNESSISPSKIPLSMKLQNMKLKLNINSQKKNLDSLDSLDFGSNADEVSTSPIKSGFDEFYKHFRSNEISDELALLQKYHQDGVYVTPSLKSLQIWFGVLFVRAGLYEEGIFHFTVYFPDDYPLNMPVIRFKSKVFHPQIDELNGGISLNTLFKTRSTNRIHVWEVISYMRSLFYHLNVKNALNQKAAELFENDFISFKARCRASVLDSILEYEEQRHQQQCESENPLKCALIDGELCKAVKSLFQTRIYAENNRGIMLWAKSQLGKVLNNISYYTSQQNITDENLTEDSENDSHQLSSQSL